MAICVHPWRAKRNQFQRALRVWFRKNGRDLPWRRTRDPYAILVSEFMLQQTQIATVIPYYHAWLARFPDFQTLAHAPESDVLHAWQGLGYYARARNLQAAAKIIARDFAGALPENISEISQLPGLGRYTANAVASFAFDQPLPIVEANTARLFARLLDLQIPIDSTAGRAALWDAAASIVPEKNSAEHNSALMDLGATICTPRAPQCPICPLQKLCAATRPNELPIKAARRATKFLTERHAFTTRRDHILLQQSTDRWRGMWILPPLANARADAPLHVAEFPFTHHRITLAIHRQSPRRAPSSTQRWFRRDTLASIPMPSPHRRALDALLAAGQKRCSTKHAP